MVLLLLGLSGFFLATLLTPLARSVFGRLGVLDHPDRNRKFHARPIPRAGGIVIAISYVTALAIMGPRGSPLAWRLFPAAALIFATGLLDDLKGLKPWHKLTGQIAAGLLAWEAGVRIGGIHGQPLGMWCLPVTILWLVGCSNAFNLIDGVDGLAAGVGLLATVTTLGAALLQHHMELAIVTIPLAGALLGFLRYNFNPASIFLGDSGSLLIGFLLGCYGILWSHKSATLLGMSAPLIALAIPLLDTGLSILRRFLRNQPIFTADRGHIHHRLLDRGLTPRRAVLMLYGVCGLCAVFSLCMINGNLATLTIVLFCVAAWIGIGWLGYLEFGVAGRMVLNGAFRRVLHTQLVLRHLEDTLERAVTPDECWEVIRSSCRELGFRGVQLHAGGQHYSQGGETTPENCWSVHIPLSGSDYVEAARAFDHGGQRAIVAPFADVIRNTLGAKLAAFGPKLAKSAAAGAIAVTLAIVGSISSSAPFHLRGVAVPTGGVPSWPLLAGDEIETDEGSAVVAFKDGRRITLGKHSRATVSMTDGAGRLRLRQGTATPGGSSQVTAGRLPTTSAAR